MERLGLERSHGRHGLLGGGDQWGPGREHRRSAARPDPGSAVRRAGDQPHGGRRVPARCLRGVRFGLCEVPVVDVVHVGDQGLHRPCRDQHRQLLTLIVKKVTVPSPDPLDTSFAFAETGPSGFTDSFSLKNGEQDVNTGLNPGTYTASETVPANYVLTSAVCDNGSPV